MDSTLAWYLEDLNDYIIAFNDALIKLEKDLYNKEYINTIFRVAHSVKSNSGTLKLSKIREVMHSMEDILHDVREGNIEMNRNLVDVLYLCHDFLHDSLEVIKKDNNDLRMETETIMELLENIKHNNRFHIPEDLIELIEENINRGYGLYHIKADIFNGSPTVDQINHKIKAIMKLHGHIIATLPMNITDSDIDDSIQLLYTHSEFLILSEENQNKMLNLLRDEGDVIRYECNKLNEHQRKLFYKKNSTKEMVSMALRRIDEIKLDALDIKNEFVNSDVIEKILANFKQVSMVIHHSGSCYAKMVITKICEILNKMENNKICFDASDLQVFVFLCNRLSELVQDASLETKKEFINDIEDKMMYLTERCGQQRRRIGDILVDKGIISSKDVEDILNLQKKEYRNLKFGQVAVIGNKASADDIIETLLRQNVNYNNTLSQDNEKETIRIASHKIDKLGRLLNQLQDDYVKLENELTYGDNSTIELMSGITETIKTLKEVTMSFRVVSIKPYFYRLSRVARETASELGKSIKVVLEGENIEVDKTISEKIIDPLTHLVRNAIAHGIEDEITRLSRGKDKDGRIIIGAKINEGDLCIELSDDGGGIDINKIYKIAIDRNILDPSKIYSEDEILNIIYNPGFTTQEFISNISGRGIGMDVVKAEIEKIRGNIQIKNKIGKGCTFKIKIPMYNTAGI